MLNYFGIALAISIGWFLGRYIMGIVAEIFDNKLVETEFWKVKVLKTKSSNKTKDNRPIGFYAGGES